jgi:hypothetical protein
MPTEDDIDPDGELTTDELRDDEVRLDEPEPAEEFAAAG